MQKNNIYTQPMDAWPDLQPFGKKVPLQNLGLDLFCFEAGDTKHPSLLLIHGLGDEADTWRHVFLSLSKQFHGIAMDLPGFGRSDKPARKYTPAFMQAVILELMDALKIPQATLIGSSLGAILSHHLALTHPEAVSKLILVDGGLLQTTKMSDRSLTLMAIPVLGEWFYTHLRKNPQAAFESLKPVYRDLDTLPKADRDFLFTRVNRRVWSNGQRRAYFSTLRNLMPWVVKTQNGLKERLSNLKTPTLIIRGEEDGLFSEETAHAILQSQPNATLATLPGTGHLPQQEDPQTFLNIVLDWLSK